MFLDFNFKTMPSILLQLNLVCLIHNFVKVQCKSSMGEKCCFGKNKSIFPRKTVKHNSLNDGFVLLLLLLFW